MDGAGQRRRAYANVNSEAREETYEAGRARSGRVAAVAASKVKLSVSILAAQQW